jgi:fatty-acyl-CoA synthase
MAAGLVAAGVKAGDRVAFLSFNTNVLLEGYFATPLAGGVTLPLNVRLHPTELQALLRHALPRMLFYEQDFSPIINDLRSAAPDCEFISIEEGSHNGDRSLSSVLEYDPLPLPDIFSIDENATAELFYTSGSTGRPKGVMLSHRTLYLHALSLASCVDHSDDYVVLHTVPLFHANGWGFPQFATMAGLKQVMVRRFDPPQVFRLIQDEAATLMILVPTMAAALLNCPDRSAFNLASLRQIIIGGAASSPELIEQLEGAFPSARAMAGYGLTETAPVVSTARAKSTVTFTSESQRRKFASTAGWPFHGVEVRVVDASGIDVPRDYKTVGEVIVRGDNVMDGYYRDPDLTRQAIVDNWFHTGDMAIWNEERCIHVVDRKKDIIIRGGENIASIEVEHAILANPEVAECAVVAAPDERWGEVPVAIVVLKNGASLTDKDVLAFAAKRLAKFELPQQIIFRSEPLPKNGAGKIVKYALREPFWVGKERRVQG